MFAEMKKESHAKKMVEMQKFKIEKQESGGGDELLDAFNDELDAMRGEDSPEEDGLLQDVSNQYRFGPGRTDAALEALEEDEEPEEEEVKYYTEEFRAEIEAYRAKVATENKHKKTVKTNLDNLFQNFQVVTQQRHKISLEQINEFDSDMAPKQQEEGVTAQNNLAAAIFSEINPFAQFVIQDILQESKDPESINAEGRHWELHEDLFKRSPDHVVNPDNLKKSSSQMFSVYKYYENPGLRVKSNYYTEKDDFMEVRNLVPAPKFFDAPEVAAASIVVQN